MRIIDQAHFAQVALVVSCSLIWKALAAEEWPSSTAPPSGIEIYNPDPVTRYNQFWKYLEDWLRVGPDHVVPEDDNRWYQCNNCSAKVNHEIFRYNSTEDQIAFFGTFQTTRIDCEWKYPEDKWNHT
jgi:hypothetical protein